ncbi:MAG: FAD-binding protein [Coriobacteriaceae bacterium]|jgi:hypothetical protein|nr:FAD-binding protein [Coriobacteriaceae bacterium]
MADLSRRGFLKGAGLIGGIAATTGAASVIGLTGCSSGGSGDKTQGASSPATGAASDIVWDEEYDVVIVGSGLAGASAAVALAIEGNGETGLLIEKGVSALGNGNSPFSGGSVIYTDAQHQAGCLTYWKDLRANFDTTPDDVLEAFVKYMATTVDFFKKAGAQEQDYTLYEPGKVHLLQASAASTDADGAASDDSKYSSGSIISCWPEYPEFESSTSVGRMIFSGKELSTVSKFMLSAVQAHDDVITHKTEAPFLDLVQDKETKAILGIQYKHQGKTLYAKANKGVIMCLGGFERNHTMLQDYLSMPVGHHLAGDGNTGDGFKPCADVGADFWHMNSMAGTWNGAMKFDGSQHSAWFTLGRQYGITVGINGRRYYMDVDYVVSQNWYYYLQGKGDLRTDTACRHGHQNIGGEWPHMVLPEKSWFIFDSAHVEQAVRGGVAPLTAGDPVAEGWAVKADTLEELAALIDVPADELATTVEVWNDSCDRGIDVQYYRAPDWLTSVKEAPFYAIRCEPEFINTDGGPVRNAKAQIVGRDGNPIPNLYSSGEFGSVWCNMYQGGGNLSECVNFSRIAIDALLGKEA